MKQFAGLVTVLSRVMDRMAGFCMVAVMALVVANILFRALLNKPILGTYEYVGFLTAAAIGLALASCAAQNGHIAVSIVVDRFSCKIQAAVDAVTGVVSICFWGLAAWYIGKYANSMIVSGLVSPTTQTPFYHFVYLIAFGIFALCLVLFVKMIESIYKAVVDR